MAMGVTIDARLTAYIDQQLDPGAIADAVCDAKLAGAPIQNAPKDVGATVGRPRGERGHRLAGAHRPSGRDSGGHLLARRLWLVVNCRKCSPTTGTITSTSLGASSDCTRLGPL